MSIVVHRRGWRSAAITFVACIGLAMPLIARADDGGRATYRGRRVIDALAQLRREGLPIVLSSAFVPSTLVVKKEPRAGTSRQIAVDILAPHGLALTEGPGGTWLVVKKPPPTAGAAPAPPPAVGELGKQAPRE